jgi:hypothetical protein
MTKDFNPEGPIDWERETRRLASIIADIAATAARVVRPQGHQSALVERGQILAFLNQARDAAAQEGDSPVTLQINIGGALSERARAAVPVIACAVIDALIEAIEQGLHLDNRVAVVRLGEDDGETRQ